LAWRATISSNALLLIEHHRVQLAGRLGAPRTDQLRIDLLDLVAERGQPERVREARAGSIVRPACACRAAPPRARASAAVVVLPTPPGADADQDAPLQQDIEEAETARAFRG
jgi:hypothetical protein